MIAYISTAYILSCLFNLEDERFIRHLSAPFKAGPLLNPGFQNAVIFYMQPFLIVVAAFKCPEISSLRDFNKCFNRPSICYIIYYEMH